jgi:hypothetical protein
MAYMLLKLASQEECAPESDDFLCAPEEVDDKVTYVVIIGLPVQRMMLTGCVPNLST